MVRSGAKFIYKYGKSGMAAATSHSPSASIASISRTCLSAFVVLHSVSYYFMVMSVLFDQQQEREDLPTGEDI